MSEWYEECKKPMAGKLGEAIEEITKNELVCPSSVARYAKKLLKKHKVKKEFLISEIGRHHDFHNAWSGDEKYTVYRDKEPYSVIRIRSPAGDRHMCGEITNKKEMVAWLQGYHTASSNCYDRFNKTMLLMTMYLEQENV